MHVDEQIRRERVARDVELAHDERTVSPRDGVQAFGCDHDVGRMNTRAGPAWAWCVEGLADEWREHRRAALDMRSAGFGPEDARPPLPEPFCDRVDRAPRRAEEDAASARPNLAEGNAI